MTGREAAYRLIVRMEDGAYSNLAGSAVQGLDERERAFAQRIAWGVVQRRLTLMHILRAYSKREPERLDKEVRISLLMGLYQIYYMDVPDSAAVNESVKLVKKLGKTSASAAVNGILRSVLRDGKPIPPARDDMEALEVRYSVPEELIRCVMEGYGKDNALIWLENSAAEQKTALRAVNISPEDLAAQLGAYGAKTGPVPDSVICDRGDAVTDRLFDEGAFYVQGLSSQVCALSVDPKPGECVLDICASPGGKSFTMAGLMEGRGEIISCDLHPKRVRLIEQGAKRLGIDMIRAVCNDGTVHSESLPMADRVLCDVPCSGYGVISSKPEIRYKPLDNIKSLPDVQYRILETSAGYVKPGGVLVYSTCTVNRAENEDVTQRFLSCHPEFERDAVPQYLADIYGFEYEKTIFAPGYDGFYICRMKRVR